jgi:Kef-type K+ transport system membrane component KefB
MLLSVLIVIAIIIGAARIGAWLFSRIGQPQVVGEIATGLLLGPSCLGRLRPDWIEFVAAGEIGKTIAILSQLGLVLLMFLIGLEFDFGHLRRVGRTAARVALAGIVVPFALGAALAWSIHPHVAAEVAPLGFVLFVATALSITAIPILGRIMIEFNIHRTALGTLAITAAAVDDALGWILLAAVSGVSQGAFQWSAILGMILGTALFVAACLAVRPLIEMLAHRAQRAGFEEPGLGFLSFVLVLVLISAIISNWIGIFSIFGPFVLGAVLSGVRVIRVMAQQRMRQFVTVFFLPIFFTYTGLHTDVGLLDSPIAWLICGLVLAAAIGGKMVGCGLAARLEGLDWPASACIAALMNTRALMGLIAINVGRELHVIPDNVFCMLVLMAVVTTFMTSPLLRRWLPAALAGHASTQPGEPDVDSLTPARETAAAGDRSAEPNDAAFDAKGAQR